MRLSIQQASQKLGVTEHNIRRRLCKGELQGEQVLRAQGFTWLVNQDDNDLDDQPMKADSPGPLQEPVSPVGLPFQPPTLNGVQVLNIAPSPLSLSTAQLAELHALRSRVAVLEEEGSVKKRPARTAAGKTEVAGLVVW